MRPSFGPACPPPLTAMGSASSKAARISAAKSGKKPSWSGARPPAYDPKTSSTPPPRTRQAWASESKDEEIQRDAKDPQLLANLSRLKPVHVHHHTLQSGTEARQDQSVVFRELFESRVKADVDAASARTPRNRLHVSSLVALLEEHQNLVVGGGGASDGAMAAATAVGQLGEKYGMDVERLQRLVRSVNVPSAREDGGGVGSVRRYVKDTESGEDIVVTEVVWKEPTVLREDFQVHPSSSRV
ncbi:hypothetical protein BJV74DRAFT_812296 [Russula compacta]|nr:hypothetical protein BJV74DRAFT_812296 [Russula compacta]